MKSPLDCLRGVKESSVKPQALAMSIEIARPAAGHVGTKRPLLMRKWLWFRGMRPNYEGSEVRWRQPNQGAPPNTGRLGRSRLGS